MGRRIGFAVSSANDIAIKHYMSVLGTDKIITPGGGWREFYAWVRGLYWKPLTTVVVGDEYFVPWLEYVKHKLRPYIVALNIGGGPEFDKVYTYADLGWGIDGVMWRRVGARRQWRWKPIFMADSDALRAQIVSCGYDAVCGGQGAYSAADILVVGGHRPVPYDIYEAAATGMATLSIQDNAHWLREVSGYTDVFIDTDGLGIALKHVTRDDFKFRGTLAAEVVPGIRELRRRLFRLLLP